MHHIDPENAIIVLDAPTVALLTAVSELVGSIRRKP